MEQVQPAQRLDLEIAREIAAQLLRRKQVDVHREAAPVEQLDAAAVMDIVLAELLGVLDSIDEDRGRAADRTDGGDEEAARHPGQLLGDPGQAYDLQMAQHAIETNGEID